MTTTCSELLLSGLRSGLHGGKSVVLKPLDGALCRAVVDLSVETRLSFQVLDWLRAENEAEGGSSEFVKKLSCQIREAAARNALQRFHARLILEHCARRGIPVILTKGLWLADLVYREPGARDACDIDLLLRPADIPAFTDVVRELGFDVPPSGADLASDGGTTNEFALWHRGTGVLVDVHWSLTNPVTEEAVDEDTLWARSELVDLAGTRCRTLALEDHLLYLCFHAAVHHKFWALGPRCLVDIAMVLRQPPRAIQWGEIVLRARALGWQKPAWLMFALVQKHLGVAAPTEVMQALHAPGPDDEEVCQVALEAIFAAHTQDSVYRTLAHLTATQSWRQRAVVLARVLVPSRVQMTNQFGCSEDVPTWRLHLRRWRLKAGALLGTFWGLLTGSPSHRAELTRTRRIQAWLVRPGADERQLTRTLSAAIFAMLAIPVVTVLLRRMTLSRLLAWMERNPAGGTLHLPPAAAVAIARGVSIAAAHGPWPAKCLTRSLVLHWLLQRRGFTSVLRIGVARDDAFRAHAWVECGGVPVNDRPDVASIFTPFDSLSFERRQVAR